MKSNSSSVFWAGNLRYGDLAIVIANSGRHTAKELEGSLVAFLKRLSTLAWERLNVQSIAVRQRHYEQGELLALSGQIDIRIPEIDLGLTRWMR
ncbi:MAG: hypothetical protein MKZ95_03840 [Pirellulales bacterium]|nr:hypothetical protein [Pirellulales bacterium]